MQRTGRYGIRSNLGVFIDKYFSERYKGFTVEINTLIQEDVIRKILYGGTVKKLRCIKYQAPVDGFDGLDEGHEEVPYNMEIVLSASRIPVMGKIKNFLSQNQALKA